MGCWVLGEVRCAAGAYFENLEIGACHFLEGSRQTYSGIVRLPLSCGVALHLFLLYEGAAVCAWGKGAMSKRKVMSKGSVGDGSGSFFNLIFSPTRSH